MQSPGRSQKAPADTQPMLPTAVKVAMVLSCLVGAAVTLRWSSNPPKFVLVHPFRAGGALQPRLLAGTAAPYPPAEAVVETVTWPAVQVDMQAEDSADLPAAPPPPPGWPECIQVTRDLIEDMAASDAKRGGWLRNSKVWARRLLLQEGGGDPDSDASAGDGSGSNEDSSSSGSGSSEEGGRQTSDAGMASQDSPVPDNSSQTAQDAGTAETKSQLTEEQEQKQEEERRQQKEQKRQQKEREKIRARRKKRTKRSSLLAVPTANVWAKTELLLQSLTANSDAFELLVVDELSSDETPQKLDELGIWWITPPERLGVTYNWNLAYRAWLETDHQFLFYVNNDVLIPDGVVDTLARAMSKEGGDCDLVTPQSTIKGKGYWGSVEGLELQLNLTDAGHQFVSNPLNYRRVQEAFNKAGCQDISAVRREQEVHQRIPGFSGFFFGVRRNIQKWAFDEDNLFNPGNRLFAQEQDLFSRSQKAAKKAKICMHTGTFVYHFKGSTLPLDGNLRKNWQMPGKASPKRQQRKPQSRRKTMEQ